MSVPSVFKRESQIDRKRVEGKALWQTEFGHILKEQSLFLCSPIKEEPSIFFTVPFAQFLTTVSSSHLTANPHCQRTCQLHINHFHSLFLFFFPSSRLSYMNLIIFILQERGKVALLLWWGTEGGAICISCKDQAAGFLIQSSRPRTGHGAAV